MTAAAETVSTPPPSAKPRIAFLDNARFWAMVLVVIGHPLLYFTKMDSGRAIYYWIFLFHMPLFVMLSGYVSRNFRFTSTQIQRTVSSLVVPYLIVESIYQVLSRHWTGHPDPYMLLSPKWVAWFLMALFMWRFSTPIWHHIKHPIPIAIAISLLSPLTEIPNVMAMPKVVGLLPFYVAGMYLTIENLQRLATWRVRAASFVFLVGVAVVCALYCNRWTLTWTKWRDRYDEPPLLTGPFEGIGIRALLIVVAFAMCFAVLSFIPWGESVTTTLGGRTLYSYLLHGFVIVALAHETHLFEWLKGFGFAGVAVTIAAAAVLAVVLMTKPVEVLFRPFFEPRLNWLFRPQPR